MSLIPQDINKIITECQKLLSQELPPLPPLSLLYHVEEVASTDPEICVLKISLADSDFYIDPLGTRPIVLTIESARALKEIVDRFLFSYDTS